MQKERRKTFLSALLLLGAFVLWTLAVVFLDVRPIGPDGAEVGLATVNGFFHRLTGVHMSLYTVTDRLSIVPLGFVAAFAAQGLLQWIRRKRLLAVDKKLLLLGLFYATVLAVYVLFEIVPVNTRPVLIEGIAENSYPSSTTVLVLCVMPSACRYLKTYIRSRLGGRCITLACVIFTACMIIGRAVSGVHWLSDIVGGILLSADFLMMYRTFLPWAERR